MRVLLKPYPQTSHPYLVGGVFEVENEVDRYYYLANGLVWPKEFAEVVNLVEITVNLASLAKLKADLHRLPNSTINAVYSYKNFGFGEREKVLDLTPQAVIRLRELVEEDLRLQIEEKTLECKRYS